MTLDSESLDDFKYRQAAAAASRVTLRDASDGSSLAAVTVTGHHGHGVLKRQGPASIHLALTPSPTDSDSDILG